MKNIFLFSILLLVSTTSSHHSYIYGSGSHPSIIMQYIKDGIDYKTQKISNFIDFISNSLLSDSEGLEQSIEEEVEENIQSIDVEEIALEVEN